VPLNYAPVDQGAYTRMMLVTIEPKTDRDTGVQYTSKDGSERKWTAQVVASLPSRWDAGRSDSDVLSVTVTCSDDPTGLVHEGDPVEFKDLTVSAMPPEMGDTGRIRGGKPFYQANGIRSKVPAAHRAKSDG
jgi:hypothetical protein